LVFYQNAENLHGPNKFAYHPAMSCPVPSSEIVTLLSIAEVAGLAIMEIYNSDFSASLKHDQTPVTAADVAAENIILPALAKHFPDIPVISEEQAAAGHVPKIASTFFLVDPLDGTKEFINRNGEFTVNIALIKNGKPALGVIYAPAIDEMFWGEIGNGSAWRANDSEWQSCLTRAPDPQGLSVMASRSHRDAATEAYLKTVKVKDFTAAGSSLKFCRLAQGQADLYPRFGRTMEWDIAAGHAILAAAGGSVTKPDGTLLTYGKPTLDNPGFIARGSSNSATWKLT
jgi:3'(2'), 5'-bisphosphate nucleotidase